MTTALGPIRVTRGYSWHPGDGGAFRADTAPGIDGFLTRQATRLATLAGVEHSFARAQQVLAEMCGWSVDDDVIRRATPAEARRAADGRPARGDAAPFPRAAGGVEVLIDAGKVNTLGGWRDVQIGLFVKRAAGAPAAPTDWDARAPPGSDGSGHGRGWRGGGPVRGPAPARGRPTRGDGRRGGDGAGGRGRVDLEPGGRAPAAGGGRTGHLPRPGGTSPPR